MRKLSNVLFAAAVSLAASTAAHAAIIASDSFITTATATAGDYLVGNINGQTATNGTTGYYAGVTVGSQIAGWNSGTAATLASTTALSHPLTVNPVASGPDGSASAAGNGNTRLQYRDLASVAPPASTTYFYSALARQSANAYTGTTFAGLGPSRATGANGVVPSTGIDIGFLNGSLTLFYNNGGTDFLSATNQETLVPAATANSTYLVELALTVTGTTATITPKVYNAAGTLVNNPAAQAVTGTLNTATDLGAFQVFETINFNGGSPAQVNYDEFRFGTVESDVVATPEPGSIALLGLAATALLARRRRTR